MALQIYLSSGTVPGTTTEPTSDDPQLEWDGFGIPVFQYGEITNKKVYLRDIEHDNPEDPEGDWTYSYPTFYVHSVTWASATTPFYQYDAATQFYSNTGSGSDWTDVAGIVNGTKYDYFQVFDQSQVSYLPYESAFDAAPVVNAPFPADAVYDPDGDPPSHPVDTAFAAMADGRSEVEVSFTLTVVWSSISMEDESPTTTTFNFVEPCTQSGDSGVALQTLLAQSSYAAGYRPISTNGDKDPWTWGTEPVSVSFD